MSADNLLQTSKERDDAVIARQHAIIERDSARTHNETLQRSLMMALEQRDEVHARLQVASLAWMVLKSRCHAPGFENSIAALSAALEMKK